MRIVIGLAALLVMAGCGGVSSEKAAADYAKLNPGHTVVGVRPSEVDVIGYTFEVTFQAPGDPQVRVTEFGYVKTKSGDWVPRDVLSAMERSTTQTRMRRTRGGPAAIQGWAPRVTSSLLETTRPRLRLFPR